MAVAEVHPPPQRTPIEPPRPERAPPDMGVFARIVQMRRSAISTWGERAYTDDVIKSSLFGRNSLRSTRLRTSSTS